jgi:hypothetical protein
LEQLVEDDSRRVAEAAARMLELEPGPQEAAPVADSASRPFTEPEVDQQEAIATPVGVSGAAGSSDERATANARPLPAGSRALPSTPVWLPSFVLASSLGILVFLPFSVLSGVAVAFVVGDVLDRLLLVDPLTGGPADNVVWAYVMGGICWTVVYTRRIPRRRATAKERLKWLMSIPLEPFNSCRRTLGFVSGWPLNFLFSAGTGAAAAGVISSKTDTYVLDVFYPTYFILTVFVVLAYSVSLRRVG